MDRYFAYDKCIYDREIRDTRACFSISSSAEDYSVKLNRGDLVGMSFAWCGSEHLIKHGPWAPDNYYMAEYILACQVLGEDYFA